MAHLVLSVTRRHCNQLDTIEGGRRVGGSSSELSLRPHALIFTSTIVNQNIFCLQTTHWELHSFRTILTSHAKKG